jgi:hypothetical protein
LVFGGMVRISPIRRFVGRITTMSQTRVWLRQFDDHDYYILVTVTNGDVFLGYPKYTSNDPTATAPDIVLGDPERVNPDGSHAPIEVTESMLIPASEIRWIQFLAKPRSPATSAPDEVAAPAGDSEATTADD